jgi:hypothetical protein
MKAVAQVVANLAFLKYLATLFYWTMSESAEMECNCGNPQLQWVVEAVFCMNCCQRFLENEPEDPSTTKRRWCQCLGPLQQLVMETGCCEHCSKPVPTSDKMLEDHSSEFGPTDLRTVPRSELNLSWPEGVNYLDTEDEQYVKTSQEIVDFLQNLEAARGLVQPNRDEVTSGGKADQPSAARRLAKINYTYASSKETQSDDPTKIRILTLSPGKNSDPLYGILEEKSLHNELDYEALSYTWADESGDATMLRNLFLGSNDNYCKRLPITKNCYAALQCLRKPREERRLWIDSVCINQQNPDEKRVQIGLMRDIYQKATRVLIYLGEGNDQTNQALEYMMLQSMTPGDYGYHHIKSLFDKQYFSRVWILQEIAHAKEIYIYCGEKWAPWLNFHINSIEVLPKTDVIPPRISLCRVHEVRSATSLGKWLFNGMPCKATRAEDKIFAFFGLFHDSSHYNLVADHNLSVEQVYTGISAFLATEGNCLGELLRRASCRLPGLKPDLPSWVPDFRREAPESPTLPGSELRQICFRKRSPRLSNGKVLKRTGSLVISGYRLVNLNVQPGSMSYTSSSEQAKLHISFQQQFELNDCIYFIPTSDCPVLVLHLSKIRNLTIKNCYSIAGQCTVGIWTGEDKDSNQPIALFYPGKSLADQLFPLEREEFGALWTAYQILLRYPDFGSKVLRPRDSEAPFHCGLYDDYQALCSGLSGHDTAHQEIIWFREFWERTSHEVATDNIQIIKHLTSYILYHSSLTALSDLVDVWKRCEQEATVAVLEFLASIRKNGFRELDKISDHLKEVSLQRISALGKATVTLMDGVKWEEIYGIACNYPKVKFYAPLGWPESTGWHFGFLEPPKVKYLKYQKSAQDIFQRIATDFGLENENLMKFSSEGSCSDEQGLACLLGDWTDMRRELQVIPALAKLTKEERSAIVMVGSIAEKLLRCADFRTIIPLEMGQEEEIIIV